jgi:hypothetical protein
MRSAKARTMAFMVRDMGSTAVRARRPAWAQRAAERRTMTARWSPFHSYPSIYGASKQATMRSWSATYSDAGVHAALAYYEKRCKRPRIIIGASTVVFLFFFSSYRFRDPLARTC